MNLTAEAVQAPEAISDLPVEDGYELLDGHLVERSMGAKASRIGARVTRLLESFASDQDLGEVFNAECGYQIFKGNPKQLRKPDVSFVARGRLPDEQPPDGHMTIPPDLVVEVISPNDLAVDVDARVRDYLGAGARLMWLLYPLTGAVWVVRKDGSGVRLGGEQEVSGEDVLPGFSCQVQAFFVLRGPSKGSNGSA